MPSTIFMTKFLAPTAFFLMLIFAQRTQIIFTLVWAWNRSLKPSRRSLEWGLSLENLIFAFTAASVRSLEVDIRRPGNAFINQSTPDFFSKSIGQHLPSDEEGQEPNLDLQSWAVKPKLSLENKLVWRHMLLFSNLKIHLLGSQAKLKLPPCSLWALYNEVWHLQIRCRSSSGL